MSDPPIQIEFFHDCLSAWCYPASPRIRQLARQYPNIQVIQRAFPMAASASLFAELFDNPQQAKREVVMQHWEEARETEQDRRIQCELMMSRDFPYPHSLPSALGAKAAELQGGQTAHWDYFDRVQQAHLTECRNIADYKILADCAESIGLNKEIWLRDVHSERVHTSLREDMAVAEKYGISRNPALVANGRFHFPGIPKSIFGYSIGEAALELWRQDILRRLKIGYQIPPFAEP